MFIIQEYLVLVYVIYLQDIELIYQYGKYGSSPPNLKISLL